MDYNSKFLMNKDTLLRRFIFVEIYFHIDLFSRMMQSSFQGFQISMGGGRRNHCKIAEAFKYLKTNITDYSKASRRRPAANSRQG